MIEVPAPLVSLSLYEVDLQDQEQFNKYVKKHKYDDKDNNVGFAGGIYLDKSRIAYILLFNLEEVRYNVGFKQDQINYTPLKFNYIDKAIIIFNTSGCLEIIGENTRNEKIIKNMLSGIKDELKIDINHHPILSTKTMLSIGNLLNKGDIVVSRLAYHMESKNIKRYEYGSNLTARFENCLKNSSEIFAIAGAKKMGNINISFYAKKYGRIIIYNMVKTPLIWNNIFQFIDEFIYQR